MYSSTISLTSALDGWVVNATPRLPPGKILLARCIGGWVGPTAGLDECGKSRPHWDSITGPPNPQRVATPTELFRPTKYSIRFIFVTITILGFQCSNITINWFLEVLKTKPSSFLQVVSYRTVWLESPLRDLGATALCGWSLR
jgi:hypothetical protein